MKFVCLGYADYSLFSAMSESEMTAAMENCFAYDDDLRRNGQFAGGEALQPADHAVTLRHRDGKTVVTDGPFAETKEQLGGILFLEASDMSQAIELMSGHPGVMFGPFEIRPADESINAMIEARQQTSRRSPMSNEKNTVRLHRVLRAPAERVYKAFVDADALCRWLPPYGFLGKIHQFDARVGGGYRMSFTNFDNGQCHRFEAKFVELVPVERIRHVDKFDDPNLPGEMDVTISLRTVLCGTEMTIVQTGIPDAIPVEMCYHGWQESLLQLANLVEHEIPS